MQVFIKVCDNDSFNNKKSEKKYVYRDFKNQKSDGKNDCADLGGRRIFPT